MSDDKATVLDSALERLGYFKIRCQQLEGALCDAILLAEQGHYKSEAVRRWRAILAGTEERDGDKPPRS